VEYTLNPAGTELWVTCASDSSIHIIDTATDEVDRFLEFPDSGTEPMRGVFSNAGDVFYVTLWGLGQVGAIQSDAEDLDCLRLCQCQSAVWYWLRMTMEAALSWHPTIPVEVVILDVDPFEILDTVETDSFPWAIAVDAEDVAYVTHGSGDVYFVNINTATLGGSEYVGA